MPTSLPEIARARFDIVRRGGSPQRAAYCLVEVVGMNELLQHRGERPRRSRFGGMLRTVLCLGVAIIPAAALLIVSAPAAQAQEDNPLTLAITPSSQTVTSGAPVSLSLTLTNDGSSECEAASIADGSIVVAAYLQNGTDISSSAPTSISSPDNPLSTDILDSLESLGPDDSVSIPWTSLDNDLTGNQAFPAFTWAGDADPDVQFLDTATPGTYEVEVYYLLPAIPGVPDDVCAQASNTATATITVEPSGGKPSVSNASDTSPAPGVEISDPDAAVAASTPPTTFGKAVDACFKLFKRTDPRGLLNAFSLGQSRTPKLSVTIRYQTNQNYNWFAPANRADATTTRSPVNVGAAPMGTGNGSNGSIYWNPTLKGQLEGGTTPVNRDPCASLYHEWFHAYEAGYGISDRRFMGGIPLTEVNATRAENAYRRGQTLDPRTMYGRTPLPSTLNPVTLPTCTFTKYTAPKKDPFVPGTITAQIQETAADGLDNVVPVSTDNATVTGQNFGRGSTATGAADGTVTATQTGITSASEFAAGTNYVGYAITDSSGAIKPGTWITAENAAANTATLSQPASGTVTGTDAFTVLVTYPGTMAAQTVTVTQTNATPAKFTASFYITDVDGNLIYVELDNKACTTKEVK